MSSLLRVLKSLLSSLGRAEPIRHRQRAQSVFRPSKVHRQQTQNVGVVDINPTNLMTTLRRRYGNDGFEVHVGGKRA